MSSPDRIVPDLTRPSTALRSEEGPYFGDFGGRFLPEALVPALDELTEMYEKALIDPEFTAELDRRLGITDGILRNLIVKRDPRHVAALNAQKAKKAEENNIDVEAIAVEAVEAPAAESAE